MSKNSLTRRAAFAVPAAAALAGSTAAAQPARKTFVLVHGAFHGGWCWRRVTDILERQGHKTYAPSLTGMGDRSHLLTKDVVLDTHIADIVNLATWEDLKDICLVVHSFGGFAGSGALERIHDRVGSIVWLDAFTPLDGQIPADFISEFSRKGMAEAIAKGEPGYLPPAAKSFSLSEKDYPWIDSKLTRQPANIASQPMKLTGKRETIARKTYIRATKYPQASFDKALAQCRADPTWRTHVNETSGHDVMIDQPEWLADILLKDT